MTNIISTIDLTTKESSEEFEKTRIEAEKFLAETQGISESSILDLTGTDANQETELQKEIRESLEAIREDEAIEASKQSSSTIVVPSPAPNEIVLKNFIKMLWPNVFDMFMDKNYVDDNKIEKIKTLKDFYNNNKNIHNDIIPINSIIDLTNIDDVNNNTTTPIKDTTTPIKEKCTTPSKDKKSTPSKKRKRSSSKSPQIKKK